MRDSARSQCRSRPGRLVALEDQVIDVREWLP